MRIWLGILIVAGASSVLAAAPVGGKLPPPPKAQIVAVTETIHGVTITDNYRWLEDQNSAATRAWIAAEQKYTAEFFAGVPQRAAIRDSLSKFERLETRSVPVAANGTFFFTRREPDEEQASLYMRRGATGADEKLLDPNRLFPDHSVSIDIGAVSTDGRVLAYGLRRGGQDELEVHFLDLNAKRDLPDVLPRARYEFDPRHAFTRNREAIYYSKRLKEGYRIYRHEFGSPVSMDKEVFGAGYGPEYVAGCLLTSTERYLLCSAGRGLGATEEDLYLQKLGADGALHAIAKHVPAVLGTDEYRDTLYLLTSSRAPNGRVLRIALDQPAESNWKEIIPEGRNPIAGIGVAARRLFVTTLENVSEHLRAYELDGRSPVKVKLPSVGTMGNGGISGEEDGSEAFLSFSSFAYPKEILEIRPDGSETSWFRPAVPLRPDQVETKQIWYSSKDGTKIPMFVVGKNGQGLRDRPTLLTGYGGFNIAMSPRWDAAVAWWISQGGVFALPALRGGSEFGEAWHKAGMLGNKQNVFDDFIGAAEYLVHSGITSEDKLAIFGTSNGGLLMGAAVTQRPDLFRAVVCGAPLLDMIRYQDFKIAKLWVPEYGSSEDAAQFKYLLKYSPYQDVERGISYPAVLFWSGDNDTRVDPLHARKMTALMQAKAAPGRPILIRYDTLTGHSGGKSVDQQLDFDADFLAFVNSQIDAR